MPDSRAQHKNVPMNGKLVTGEPAVIGMNFRTLKNMRYTDTHIRGVQGMTKINSSVMDATYLKTRSAFHFRKNQPAESHVLAQAYNTGLTASQVLENKTAIPSAGNFEATELWTDSSGAGIGRFAYAPDGQMIYCNGVDSCIWGGNESKLGAFITSSDTVDDDCEVTDPRDYTDLLKNTRTDADNIVAIGGGTDSYTKLLLHMDGADESTTFTDSSDSAHEPAGQGDAQIDTARAKFGTASCLFDGTGDYLTVADHADWNFGSDPFTIDLWIHDTVAAHGICGQYVDANNYWYFKFTRSIGSAFSKKRVFYFKVVVAGETKADYTSEDILTWWTNDWYHVELARSGTSMYLFWNGTSKTFTPATAIASNAMPDLAASLEIGACSNHTVLMDGWIDEFRISKGVARHTASFTPQSNAYAADPTAIVWLVGSPRPLQGLKYYVIGGNTVASTMTGKEWSGTSWTSLTLTDNTDTGASLAITGTVTFDSTVNTSKPRYIEGYYLYWYQFTLSAGSAELYQVTLDAPFQDIVDIWDGVYRDVAKFYKIVDSKYIDNTTNVLADDYNEDLPSTYAEVGEDSYGGNDWEEVGFTEKMVGIRIFIPAEYSNDNASVMTVEYWNGEEYTTVGTIVDGTDSGGDTLGNSGVVTWNNTYTNEAKHSIQNSEPLYFYRIRWDNATDSSTRIYYVSGIPAQKKLSSYKFPVFAQGRVLLCCDMSEDKHKATCSGKFMPQAYNGDDSVDLYFGGDGELTAGVELFSLYSSTLYSIILMFKDNETWAVAGQDINDWATNTFILSTSIGCPAPLTLKTVNLSAEPGEGVNRNLAIWQGANGVYMSDGRAPIPIHLDIKEYFDRNDTRCIRASMVGDSKAWVDADKQEYHLLIASGSSATGLNTELVYDIHRNKWFEIDRTVDLQAGVEVIDTDGNPYTYGFLDTGYMERLEYGTTFDGNDIVHTIQTGDFPLSDLAMETRLSRAKLITVSKTTTTNSVTCTHYSDTGTTETAVAAVGTITMSGVATADETFVIDTQTFTWKTARSTTGEVTIGANAAAAVTNLVTAINADLDSVSAADGTGDTVVVTAASTGEPGNAIIFTEDSTNMAMDGSGTLGGTTAGIYTEGTAFTMSPAKTGFRVTIPEFVHKLDGDPFHSFKFAMTTNNETIGFEPLALVLTFHDLRED